MALTAKERARRWRERQKNDPEKHQRYLENEKERYRSRKNSGKLKCISELTERQKRSVRKRWRKNQKQKREKEKDIANLITVNTPPDSPGNEDIYLVDGRRSSGRKKVRRDRAKAYREVKKLKVKLQKKEKEIHKYKKRLYRERARINQGKDSPRTKTRKLLRGQSVSDEVRRKLLFHQTLVKGLRDKYKETRKRRTQQEIVGILPSKLLQKYKLKSYAAGAIGYSRRRVLGDEVSKNSSLSKRNSRIQRLLSSVKEFFQRDDNSRSSAGKRETITRFKVKKQKRFLNDDMKNLYTKFISENPSMMLSYSLFCRLRPFWVVKATERDRQTCLCVKHENLQYQADKLKDLGIIMTSNLNELAKCICCDSGNKGCMYRECLICKDKTIAINEKDLEKQIQWKKWATRRVEKVKKVQGKEIRYTTSMTTREDAHGTAETLVDEFRDTLKKTCRHFYNIRHQYAALRSLKETMKENEAMVHIDFSENYACKYDKEIQSVHFGPSQTQITLHTGVIYYKGDCTTSFCTVSDCTNHGPPAIWAHLNPVLANVKEINPNIDTIYFVSDGPTTQY